MKKVEKGSITVEAALIMPIIVFTIFSLIYLSFYLHDRCKIQGIIDKALHKAELTVKHDADFSTGNVYYEEINHRGIFYILFGSTSLEEDNIKKYLQEELDQGLFLAKVTDIKVSVNKFNIGISVWADSMISSKGVNSFLKPLLQIEIEEESQIHNPAELIRFSEIILDTGSKIKGVNALKEKLEKLLQ